MSEGIDIPIEASGDDGVNRITTAIDRLNESMVRLGENSAVGRLAQQMEQMNAVMATGFANLASTTEKLIQNMGTRQVAAVEESGEKVAAALEASGMKAQMARERQMDRQLSTDNSFNQARMGMLEGARERELALENLFEREREGIAQKGLASRILDYDREEQIAAAWEASLEKSRDRELAGEAMFERAREELQKKGLASRILDYDREEQIALEWEASLAKSRERALEIEIAFNRAQAQTLAQRTAQEATAAERQRALNTNYLTASPTSQVHIAQQAQVYGQLGGDAAAKYGSEAAAADALAAAHVRLAATSREVGAAQFELDGALRQVEGAFRGAAHQAGLYGLHHGQLIALLAGGGLAAALHHIAETGAEVQFQLTTLNALADQTAQHPIDIDKFVGITAGTMTGLKDAAEGVHALAQAGQSQAAAFAALPDVMRLAQLGEMSVAQAAEMAVESMHAFGKEVTDLGAIGDILVAVGSKSNVSVHKLAEDMKSAATTGQLFNLSMEEITATVGALAERGLTIMPLSSALNKLYEPSAKTAKVMKEWGLTVKDDAGSLKNYSQFMGELTAKIAEFRVPADALKQLGMSPQSIKAMEVMTQHFGDYQHLLHEAENATGKMFAATVEKADTVEGAWKRLGSTFDGSVVKAFEAARPTIQGVEEDLIRMAGSDGTVSLLANLASGVARLTQMFVENAGTVAAVVAAYAGLRIISSIATATSEYLVAKRAEIVLSAESAAVTRVETAQLQLFAVAETEAAVGGAALAASAEASAAGLRMLAVSVGGFIAIAAIAVTAVELMSGKLDEHDRKKQEQKNTYDSTTDAIQHEIDRLKGLEDQLRLTGEAGITSAAKVQMAFAQMREQEAAVKLQVAEDAPVADSSLRMAGRHGPQSRNGDQMHQDNVDAARREFEEAHKEAVKAGNLVAELETRLESVASLSKVRDLKKHVEELPAVVKPYLQTPEASAAAVAANEGLKTLRAQEITEGNVVELAKTYAEVQKDIAATKLVATAAAAGDKDAARTSIELLKEELRLKQMDTKSTIDDLKSQNKRGELGDLQLINAELREKLELDAKAADVARAERAAAGPLSGAQKQKFDNAVTTAEKQATVDTSAAERARKDMLSRMQDQELKHRADTLEKQGYLQDAFNLRWEMQNGAALARLDKDIEDADNEKYRKGLVRYREFLMGLKAEGEANAIFKMDMSDLDKQFAELKQKLADFTNHNGPGTGLSSNLGTIFNRKSLLEKSLPDLQETYAVAKADAGNDPEKLKALSPMLREIQSQAADLRNIFVDMGNTIAKSLTDAFGQGGAALGGMITTAANYDAKMKDIKATLADSDGGAEAQKKAAEDTASAQIKAYGDMAGAAKGFFNTNSAGYKVMHAAEQAFRAYELVMAVANAGRKIMLENTTTAAKVTATEIETQAIWEGAGEQVAADQVKGTSAAAVGVATQAQGDPISAWVRMAAMAAAMAALGFAVGGMGGGSDDVAKERQAANGTGTIAGDPKAKSDSIAKSLSQVEKNTYNDLTVSMDMLSALRSIESNISGFAGRLVQDPSINPSVSLNSNNGLQTTLLANFIGGPLLTKLPGTSWIGKAATAVFGGKQSLDDAGFTMDKGTLGSIAANGAKARTYADVTTDGGWFFSDDHDRKTSNLSVEANRAITQIVTGLGETVRTAAAALGIAGTEFDAKLNAFVVNLGDISLKDMTSAEKEAALQAAFSRMGDQMAQSAVSTISQFSKAGEGALETLVRVAADYQTVDAVFASYGTAFSQVGVASIAAREHLIDLAGGLDKFVSQADFFFKNFMSPAQQTAATRKAVDPTLTKYGLSSVGADAAANFTQAVIAFGAMGEAGAQAYTDLMNIAPAFKTITDATKDLQDQIDELMLTQAQQDAAKRATLDPANQLLFDQLQVAKGIAQARTDLASAYNTESQALQSSVDRLKSFSQSLHNFINTLTLGELSVLNPADKYGAARSQFDSTLAKAQANDVTAQGNLQSVAQAFLQASRTANASNQTYQSDYQRVLAVSDQMAAWADSKVSEGQASINLLHDQVSRLTSINSSVMTVADAINNLAISLVHGQDTATNTTALATVYQELLGRSPDADGLAFWNASLKNGSNSLLSIIDAIKHSAEYVAHTSGGATSVTTPSIDNGTAALPGLGANQNVSVTSQLSALYQQILHRAPDQAGLSYWTNLIDSGMSMSTVSDQMRAGWEATGGSAPAPAPAPAPVTQPDPYVMSGVSKSILDRLALIAEQLSTIYEGQKNQTDQLRDATLNAGAATGEKVAGAYVKTSQNQNWKAQNLAELR